MTSDSMPTIPEGCDAETYAVRWTQGYPLWYCEDEARAAAGEETKRQQAHGRDGDRTMEHTTHTEHAPDLAPATPEATDAPPGCYDALARLPETALVDESGMAQAFNVAGRTIRRMVERHELPPPVRFAGRAVWIVGRVNAWLCEAAEREEADARAHLEKIRRMGA